MIIKRRVNGELLSFQLTQHELYEIKRQEYIENAKGILANYEDMIVDYIEIIKDEEKLLQYAELLEEKMMSDNGELEIEAIEESFLTELNT